MGILFFCYFRCCCCFTCVYVCTLMYIQYCCSLLHCCSLRKPISLFMAVTFAYLHTSNSFCLYTFVWIHCTLNQNIRLVPARQTIFEKVYPASTHEIISFECFSLLSPNPHLLDTFHIGYRVYRCTLNPRTPYESNEVAYCEYIFHYGSTE